MMTSRHSNQPEPAASAAPSPERAADELEALTRLARAHLEPETAARWIELLRPAVRLMEARNGEAVIARLGGRPVLGTEVDWPIWEAHGPLSYIGEIDLEALARQGLEHGLDLPTEGRLLAFFFDGTYDDFDSVVGTWDPSSLAGARLVHLTSPRAAGVPSAPPEGVLEYREQEFSGRQILTFPDGENPRLRQAFGALDQSFVDWLGHPVMGERFHAELSALEDPAPCHQIGGWAEPLQTSVEYEAAEAALPDPLRHDDHAQVAESLAWRLLWQVDSDDDSRMSWGDTGRLFWLVRDGDHDAGERGPTSFTWQSS